MKAEDNAFPYITGEEQGSDPAPPAAGKRLIYPKSDGWYDIDDAGSVVGPFGTGGGGGGGSAGYRFDDPADASWGTDLGYDLEAETDTSSVPSGWAWLNQGTATYKQAFGAALIADTGTNVVRGIERNLPTEAAWVAVAKIFMPAKSVNYRNAGLYLRDGATGRLTFYSMGHSSSVGGGLAVQIDNWTNATTYSGPALGGSAPIPNLCYLAVRKNSSTSWDFLGSADGLSWANFDLARNITTFTASPSKIGFCYTSSDATRMALHWFRVRTALPA